jgi:hypothetical protein
MASARVPFFILAVLTMFLIVAFELSTLAFLRNVVSDAETVRGLGAPYLALLDGILLYSFILASLGHFPMKHVTARIGAVAALILSFFGIIGSFLLILAAFFAILLMLGLLLAVPFGTLAYLAAYADFPKSTAVGALSFIMLLKLVFLLLLALTHLGYLKMKGLLLLVGLSLLATWLTSFLIALPPGFLASITDAVGALITAIIAFIWLIVTFISSIVAVYRSAKFSSPGREV